MRPRQLEIPVPQLSAEYGPPNLPSRCCANCAACPRPKLVHIQKSSTNRPKCQHRPRLSRNLTHWLKRKRYEFGPRRKSWPIEVLVGAVPRCDNVNADMQEIARPPSPLDSGNRASPGSPSLRPTGRNPSPGATPTPPRQRPPPRSTGLRGTAASPTRTAYYEVRHRWPRLPPRPASHPQRSGPHRTRHPATPRRTPEPTTASHPPHPNLTDHRPPPATRVHAPPPPSPPLLPPLPPLHTINNPSTNTSHIAAAASAERLSAQGSGRLRGVGGGHTSSARAEGMKPVYPGTRALRHWSETASSRRRHRRMNGPEGGGGRECLLSDSEFEPLRQGTSQASVSCQLRKRRLRTIAQCVERPTRAKQHSKHEDTLERPHKEASGSTLTKLTASVDGGGGTPLCTKYT